MKASSFTPPIWASKLKHVPASRLHLMLTESTPVTPWTFSHNGKRFSLLIKRDDLTDVSASGNKIRKLEFLLADALRCDADALVSVGGTASNHCRAVAALAGRVGIDKTFLVLRKDRYFQNEAEGNLLLDNVFGAHTVLVDAKTYAQEGQKRLTAALSEKLIKEGKCSRPYIIPVGGSVTLGVWGYIQMVHELSLQIKPGEIDVIFFASGSGGTAAGIAIGMALCPSFSGTKVVGYCVCDTPQYFEEHVQHELDELGITDKKAKDIISFRDAKGEGYSISTADEVALIQSVARSSGVLLDGSYTGKAMFGFCRDAKEFEGKKCLFVHTGGAFSLFGMPKDLIVQRSLITNN